MTELSDHAPSESAAIYQQLEHYRHVMEANDPVTRGWVAFMQDLGLSDLMPDMADTIDPTTRDDSEFLNYDYQGTYDRYIGLLRSHLLHKTQKISDVTDYGVGESECLIKTSLHAASGPRETDKAEREITFVEQSFIGDRCRTAITVVLPGRDATATLFQSIYPHPLMQFPATTPPPADPLKMSITYVFRGI